MVKLFAAPTQFVVPTQRINEGEQRPVARAAAISLIEGSSIESLLLLGERFAIRPKSSNPSPHA